MYICAVANQKGGVGKTTTTQNLGVSLAGYGKNVLLIDLDAQANLTDACGMEPRAQKLTSFHLLDGSASLKDVIQPVMPGLDLVPANIDLAVAELSFAARMGRESLLRKALASTAYDFVLIDCPPSLGLLTINALTAAQGLLIPVQVEYHALAGLALMQQTVFGVRENLNDALSILGLVLTFVDERKKLNRDVIKVLNAEWGECVFHTRIRDNVSLAEAPSNGQDIHAYKSSCYGARDYAALAEEFLERTGSYS